MKKIIAVLIILGVLLSACTQSPSGRETEGNLTIGDGSNQKVYTVEDLKAFPASKADFNDVSYVGVPVSTLLLDAGIDAANLKAIKAVAIDGYSVNYESELCLREDVLVAYAQIDGELGEDDGIFRMVVPGEEGKMNIRGLVEIMAVP